MLKRYMHRQEREFAMRDDNRIVRDFEWGTEYIAPNANGNDPRKLFADFAKHTVEHSEEFFINPEISDFRFEISDPKSQISDLKSEISTDQKRLTWTSGIETKTKDNNTVYARYFPHATNKKSAVLILPHWNAKAGSYFDLCKLFNRIGLSALRLTLPYHEERNPPDIERADYLVAPNVGLTLQSLRQAVVDTRSAVSWLKKQGYEKIGIVGTSIGSCVGFFAFTHDMRIDAAVFNHVSGYPADVVWHGITTHHVRKGLADNVTLDELREYWLPISPMAYIDRLAKLQPRPQRYIYTLYDLSFPVDLSRDTIAALNARGIAHSEVKIPCGHYTLGEKPWVYYDGFKIIAFLRKHLR